MLRLLSFMVVLAIASLGASEKALPQPSTRPAIELTIKTRKTRIAENDTLPVTVKLTNKTDAPLLVQNQPTLNVVTVNPDGTSIEHGPASQRALRPSSNPSTAPASATKGLLLVIRLESSAPIGPNDRPATSAHGAMLPMSVEPGKSIEMSVGVSQHNFHQGKYTVSIGLFDSGQLVVDSKSFDVEVLRAREPGSP